MSILKEIRREITENKNPLGSHSMNQRRLRKIREGELRLSRKRNPRDNGKNKS